METFMYVLAVGAVLYLTALTVAYISIAKDLKRRLQMISKAKK